MICIGGVPVKNSFSAGPDLYIFTLLTYIDDCGGHSCAHALHPPRTHASRVRLTTRFPGSSRRRAAATRFFETRTVSVSSAGFSLPRFVRPLHAPGPRSLVLHHLLLWPPAAPHRLSCPFFSGPCSLQKSLPTRLFSCALSVCPCPPPSLSLILPLSLSHPPSLSVCVSLCLVSSVWVWV